ncbi:hypothetical protein [Halobacillus seohaensis]|uniref:YtxH domain-containing protein n=1 Tax=Halobacillus seohaensis TaxID=447421 RepID=A0ABW2EKW8_9BACI
MNGQQGRRNSFLALGTAGAIGAATMYGVSRMNRNGGFKQVAERAKNNQAMQNLQNTLPNMNGEK